MRCGSYALNERMPNTESHGREVFVLNGAEILKGGLARAKALSPERRKEIARLAVQTRWTKAKQAKSKKSGPRAKRERRATSSLSPHLRPAPSPRSTTASDPRPAPAPEAYVA